MTTLLILSGYLLAATLALCCLALLALYGREVRNRRVMAKRFFRLHRKRLREADARLRLKRMECAVLHEELERMGERMDTKDELIRKQRELLAHWLPETIGG